MTQRLKHSPYMFNKVLKQELKGLNLDSMVAQDIDDILICSSTREQCHKDSIRLLRKLSEGGHEVSLAKLSATVGELGW